MVKNRCKKILVVIDDRGVNKDQIIIDFKGMVKGLHQKEKIKLDIESLGKQLNDLDKYFIVVRGGWEDTRPLHDKKVLLLGKHYFPVFRSRVNIW